MFLDGFIKDLTNENIESIKGNIINEKIICYQNRIFYDGCYYYTNFDPIDAIELWEEYNKINPQLYEDYLNIMRR